MIGNRFVVDASELTVRGPEERKASHGGDGDELKEYWTQDPEGLAKWASAKDPWTTLHKRLLKYMKDPLAAAVASSYYKSVFGHMPNQKGKKKRRDATEILGWADYRAVKWDEAKHLRRPDGKFGSVGGGEAELPKPEPSDLRQGRERSPHRTTGVGGMSTGKSRFVWSSEDVEWKTSPSTTKKRSDDAEPPMDLLLRMASGETLSEEEMRKVRKWVGADHPRGPDGKFIKKGTGGASGGGAKSGGASKSKAANKQDKFWDTLSEDEKQLVGDRIGSIADNPMDDDEAEMAESVLKKFGTGETLTEDEKDFVAENTGLILDNPLSDKEADTAASAGEKIAELPTVPNPPEPKKSAAAASFDSEQHQQFMDMNTFDPSTLDTQISLMNQELASKSNDEIDFESWRMRRNLVNNRKISQSKKTGAFKTKEPFGANVSMSGVQEANLDNFLDDIAAHNGNPDLKAQINDIRLNLARKELTPEDVSAITNILNNQTSLFGNYQPYSQSKVKSMLTSVKPKKRSASPPSGLMRSLPVIRSGGAALAVDDLSDPASSGSGECRASYRAEVETNGPIMRLEFSKFGNWYPINSSFEGKFIERVAPGAFVKTINERGGQVKVLFNHGKDPQIGEKILGPVKLLEERSEGTYSEVPLFDTSYNRDLLPALQSGAYGSSFMFHVMDDVWDYSPERSAHNPEGVPERTVTAVRLLEFGPVTWPANPAATAGMRSDTDRYFGELRTADPEQYNVFAEMFSEFRASNSLVLEDAEARTSSEEDDRDDEAKKKAKKPIDSEEEAAEDADEPEDDEPKAKSDKDDAEDEDEDHPFGDDESKRSAQLRDLDMLEFS